MKPLNILADENIPFVEAYFGSLGQVQRVDGRGLDNSRLAGADVLLVRSVTEVDEQLLAGHAVRFVGTATSGVDHIDTDYLREAGTGFAHAPGSNANSVVEYVLAAIASLDDRLERLLAGDSVGIVGYGNIGRALARCLGGLGIGYKIYDPWLEQAGIDEAATLSQVLACDVVTLHSELTRRQPWPSVHLLGEPQIQRMGPGRLLINASRGPVVDNNALLALLQARQAPETVLDVWEGEPAINRALLEQVRYGTAHIAGYSLDGKILAARMLYEALLKHLGEAPPGAMEVVVAPAVLPVPAELDGAALVRHLLEGRYQIERDDHALRESQAGVAPASGAAAFDQLRRNYPERRELRGSAVCGPTPGHRNLSLLDALGCKLQGQGEAQA